ncbi:MAG: hypothetical protein ACRC7G_15070 [Beijerinckiaceae bacterium]
MKRTSLPPLFALVLATLAWAVPAPPAVAQTRVKLSGELVDTFCMVTGIMFSSGSAHYQCAVWCAVGGIPVSLKTADGEIYLVLRIEEDEANISNPKLFRIMGHDATVDGELIERDGVKYILVTQVADDKGLIKLTHDEHGIQPFGQ